MLWRGSHDVLIVKLTVETMSLFGKSCPVHPSTIFLCALLFPVIASEAAQLRFYKQIHVYFHGFHSNSPKMSHCVCPIVLLGSDCREGTVQSDVCTYMQQPRGVILY